MKLCYQHNAFGPKVHCIDENEYAGAPDAGPQLIGQGDTEENARADFMDRWIEREATRDMKNAVNFAKSWDSMIEKLLGVKP